MVSAYNIGSGGKVLVAVLIVTLLRSESGDQGESFPGRSLLSPERYSLSSAAFAGAQTGYFHYKLSFPFKNSD